jgi:hypothetical protein
MGMRLLRSVSEDDMVAATEHLDCGDPDRVLANDAEERLQVERHRRNVFGRHRPATNSRLRSTSR